MSKRDSMLIMKFGGTSVTNPQSVEAINILVQREIHRKPILVVSALSGITDLLVKLSHSILASEQDSLIEQIKAKHTLWIDTIFAGKASEQLAAHNTIAGYLAQLKNLLHSHNFTNQLQLHDSIVSFGEMMSSHLISKLLSSRGSSAKQVSATECIITTKHFGGADFIDAATKKHCKKTVLPIVEKNIVPVITGFIGATQSGETTILGRGGSDYSAAIIGYALNAEEIQIWTDVNGVYSADPRVIKDAKLLPQLSYQEAAELAMFGAKVLHPRTIQPAVKSGIPVRVLNTFNIENCGTLIEHNADNNDGLVKSVTWKKSAPLINIYSADMFLSKGFLQKIFAVLANKNISVNMLSASEVSVSVTLDNIGKLDEALLELSKFAKTDYIEGFGTVSLVGEQIMSTPRIMQDLFDIFDSSNTSVQMLSYSASNINISMIVPSDKISEVVPILHRKFISTLSDRDYS